MSVIPPVWHQTPQADCLITALFDLHEIGVRVAAAFRDFEDDLVRKIGQLERANPMFQLGRPAAYVADGLVSDVLYRLSLERDHWIERAVVIQCASEGVGTDTDRGNEIHTALDDGISTVSDAIMSWKLARVRKVA